MVPEARNARNIDLLNPHYITRHTQFKLREYRRERRLKNSSEIFGPINSSTDGQSCDERNILELWHLPTPERNSRGVRPFHRQRSVPIKAISKNKKHLLTSRRKQRKLPKHFTSSTKHSAFRGGNYPSTQLYHPRKESYDVHPFRGQPDGQVGSFSERENLSSTSRSKSLTLDKNFKPLPTPVANDAPLFDRNKIKRCRENSVHIEDRPSYFLTRTSKQQSYVIRKLVSEFMRNPHTSKNICRPLASSTASSQGRSYSPSLNLPPLHNTPIDHSTLEERGHIRTISKSINPASTSHYPLFTISPIESYSQTANFSPSITRSTTSKSISKDSSASDERGCIGIISKSINRLSISPHPIYPIKISSPMTSFSSPFSSGVEVGSMQTTPENITSLPSTAGSSLLSGTSQNSSEPIPSPPPKIQTSQSTRKENCHIQDGSERFHHISGHYLNSCRLPLTGNFVYPKLVSEENGQKNTSLIEDNSSKLSSLYTSENTASLPSKTKPSLLFGTSRDSSKTIPYTPYNSPIQDDIESISQSSGRTRSLTSLLLERNFVYLKTVSEENGQNNTFLKEDDTSKSSSLYQYPSQLQRTVPPNTPTYPYPFCESRNIQNVTRSNLRPYLYPAVLYSRHITGSSNYSEATNLFSEPNCVNCFLAQPNILNSLSNSEESYSTENIDGSLSQSLGSLPSTTQSLGSLPSTTQSFGTMPSTGESFGSLPSTCPFPTTEPSEMYISSNEPNSEHSGHRRNKTKISKLMSCFTACFRKSSPRQKDKGSGTISA